MAKTEGSLFDIGTMRLGIAKVEAVKKAMFKLQGRFAHLSDAGGGFLSKALAQHAVGHVKAAILAEGRNVPGYVPISIDDNYRIVKERAGGRGDHYFTGTLFESIKVLNRRYEGGRGYVAGIDQRLMVARINRRTGAKDGGQVSVAAYAADIEYGWSNDRPRPLIILAMADFINTYGPKTAAGFLNQVYVDSFKYIKQKTKEARAGAGIEKAGGVNQLFDIGEGYGTKTRTGDNWIATGPDRIYRQQLKRSGEDPHVLAYYLEEADKVSKGS